MGFVGHVLKNAQGIEWYSIVGILIFMSLFILIVYRTYRTPNKTMESYKAMLFDDDSNESVLENTKEKK